jgi:hypothetical protein
MQTYERILSLNGYVRKYSETTRHTYFYSDQIQTTLLALFIGYSSFKRTNETLRLEVGLRSLISNLISKS